MIVRLIIDMEGDYSIGDVLMMRQILHGSMQAAPGQLRGVNDHRHDKPTEENPCDECTVLAERVLGGEYE